MPRFEMPTFSIGTLIALLVLVAVFVLLITNEPVDREILLAMIGGLALARIL